MKEKETSNSESVVGFFRKRPEVLSAYVRADRSGNGDGVLDCAVILNGTGLRVRDTETLRTEYAHAIACVISGPVNVLILNTASLADKHWVLSTWDLLFDRKNYQLLVLC